MEPVCSHPANVLRRATPMRCGRKRLEVADDEGNAGAETPRRPCGRGRQVERLRSMSFVRWERASRRCHAARSKRCTPDGNLRRRPRPTTPNVSAAHPLTSAPRDAMVVRRPPIGPPCRSAGAAPRSPPRRPRFHSSGCPRRAGRTHGSHYSIRQAAYDLRKLRGKRLVLKPGRTRRYHVPEIAARTIAALLTLRDKVIGPLIAGIRTPRQGRPPKNWTTIDRDYETLRREMETLLDDLGIATKGTTTSTTNCRSRLATL